MTMSAPLPLWMAAVRRAWMSFWLMRSIAISTPACLPNSFACSSNTWSAAGMKCDHCRKCSRVPCARAGAAPAAVRTPAAEVFKKWRRVRRARLRPSVTGLREGRRARTVEASLVQGGKPVARCTAVYLKAAPSVAAAPVDRTPPRLGPDAGRPLPPHVKGWSPFFTGVDTRTVEGDLLKPGPAACWFNLERPLVPGETNSALVHAVSAADLCSGTSAVVNLREVTFVNADLTVVVWRQPRAPWILLAAETRVGDQGTGVARGTLSDLDGAFGACEQALVFERRTESVRDGR